MCPFCESRTSTKNTDLHPYGLAKASLIRLLPSSLWGPSINEKEKSTSSVGSRELYLVTMPLMEEYAIKRFHSIQPTNSSLIRNLALEKVYRKILARLRSGGDKIIRSVLCSLTVEQRSYAGWGRPQSPVHIRQRFLDTLRRRLPDAPFQNSRRKEELISFHQRKIKHQIEGKAACIAAVQANRAVAGATKPHIRLIWR